MGTNNREMGVSTSVVNVHPLSDIQSGVDGVIDALQDVNGNEDSSASSPDGTLK